MSSYLKKYAAPPTWAVTRKDTVYITKPSPGPQSIRHSLPLDLILKKLGVATTRREVKRIIHTKEILVDGTRVRDVTFPVGLFSVLTLPTKKHYRILFDANGRLQAQPIPQDEANKKITKIIGQHVLKGGKHQLNLSDGRNILTNEKQVHVGDTLFIDVPTQKIQKTLKLEKGVTIYLVDGKHVADIGTVDEINNETITYTTKANHKVQTLKDYAYVVGTDKPLITLL